MLDARDTPDLSSVCAFARSFSGVSLRSWACQEANQLCRSRSLQNPMTTFEPGRFLRLAQLSQVSQAFERPPGHQLLEIHSFAHSANAGALFRCRRHGRGMMIDNEPTIAPLEVESAVSHARFEDSRRWRRANPSYELPRMRPLAHVPKAISFHHATVSSRLFGGSTWCIKHTRAYQGRVISGPEASAMSRVPRGSGQGWA